MSEKVVDLAKRKYKDIMHGVAIIVVGHAFEIDGCTYRLSRSWEYRKRRLRDSHRRDPQSWRGFTCSANGEIASNGFCRGRALRRFIYYISSKMMRLERQVTAPSGFVVVRRIVASDGSFAPVDSYMSNDRTHIWRREAGERADAFDGRVIDEAEWIAVRRGKVIALVPLQIEEK